jgi:hypothetical protein
MKRINNFWIYNKEEIRDLHRSSGIVATVKPRRLDGLDMWLGCGESGNSYRILVTKHLLRRPTWIQRITLRWILRRRIVRTGYNWLQIVFSDRLLISVVELSVFARLVLVKMKTTMKRDAVRNVSTHFNGYASETWAIEFAMNSV